MVGIGPGPFAGMMLADMGAEVIAVDRVGGGGIGDLPVDINRRGKKSIRVDMKQVDGVAVVRALARSADGLFEGFRPGVMERTGLGPDVLLGDNPALVYGRMTGYGQTGPLAGRAGHDINYAALAGALYSIGPADGPPTVPLNLVADYGGGGMMLVAGLLGGLLQAKTSGQGQVVDVSMTEGASLLMSVFHSLRASGLWSEARGVNLLDGGAHFYGTYETSDGGFMAVGAIEPQFMAEFLQLMDLPQGWLSAQMSPSAWPEKKAALAARFKAHPRAHWQAVFEGSDACVSPVLPFWEAHDHPQAQARNSFVTVDGLPQPAPAPRFGETPADTPAPPVARGTNTDSILKDLGYDAATCDTLRASGVIA